MALSTTSLREIALAHCVMWRKRYERWARTQRVYFVVTQLGAVVFAAAASVLTAGTELEGWIKALPSAVAAMLAAATAILYSARDKTRYTTAGALLRGEENNFQCKTGPYSGKSDEEAVNDFNRRVDEIVSHELEEFEAAKPTVTP
jgi:hypothetical protein